MVFLSQGCFRFPPSREFSIISSISGHAARWIARLHPKPLSMGHALGALEKRIEEGIEWQGRYFVSAPAEMEQLGSPQAARAFALWHDWAFVCHLDGANYEFFEAVPGEELY